MQRSKIRVVKLGGSLLDLPDVSECFQRWLSTEPSMPTLLVVGGGRLVDAIRDLDRVHSFDAGWCHWLCVDLLSQTATLMERLLPEASVVRTRQQFASLMETGPLKSEPTEAGQRASSIVIAHPRAFYFPGSCPALPECWDTTSDSIAALLAKLTAATELVLLKSKSPNGNGISDRPSLSQWGREQLVDPPFAMMADGIPTVRIVNLRSFSKSLQCPPSDG